MEFFQLVISRCSVLGDVPNVRQWTPVMFVRQAITCLTTHAYLATPLAKHAMVSPAPTAQIATQTSS